QQVPTPPTHKAGKELDLILARNCTTDNLTVTPLHLSDHFFIRFDVRLIEQPSVPPPMVLFRRNLRNLSPTHFSSLVFSAHTPLSTFSSLGVNDATESLLHSELMLGQLVSTFHQTCSIYPVSFVAEVYPPDPALHSQR